MELCAGRIKGGVSERLKEAVLKTVGLLRVPWVRIPPPPPTFVDKYIHCLWFLGYNINYGELAELAEGARLLSEYMGINLYRGFKSLTLRQNIKVHFL